MCGCDSGAAPEFFERKTVKARKQHRCCECGQVIATGQRYVRSSGKWDGNVQTYSTCRRCEAVGKAFYDVEGCNPPFGGLFEQISECSFALRDAGFAGAVKLRLLEMRGKVVFAVTPGVGHTYCGRVWWYSTGGQEHYAIDANGAPVVERSIHYYQPQPAWWASEHYGDPRTYLRGVL